MNLERERQVSKIEEALEVIAESFRAIASALQSMPKAEREDAITAAWCDLEKLAEELLPADPLAADPSKYRLSDEDLAALAED